MKYLFVIEAKLELFSPFLQLTSKNKLSTHFPFLL